jgi:hypothetical protein
MPQSGAPAQLVVVYGSFTFDDTNGILIDKADDPAEGYLSGRYSCEFTLRVVTPANTGNTAADFAADAAAFRTLLGNLVAACRVPRARLQVKYGGTAALDYNPALGASLNAFHITPQLEPLSSDDDSLTSKRFRFTVTFDHPADLTGQNGRADSTTGYEATIRGRRAQTIAASYTALTTNDALSQYKASTTNAWFQGQLQTPVAGGEWELASETFSWDDEGTGGRTLNVTRVYFEAVNGLREWTVTKALSPSQALLVTISGTYIPTSTYASAKAAHDADVSTFITNTLPALFPGVPFDAKPTQSAESKQTVDGMYPFSVTFEQIVYPQGPSGNDDPNVTSFTLNVQLSTPFDANTVLSGAEEPQSLQTATAIYSAAVDVNSANGTDMQSLWSSKYQAHCTAAIKAKLRATNLITRVVDLGLDLTANRIAAQVNCIVWGSNLISLLMSEQTDESPAGNPVPMASSEPHEYWLFWGTASLILTRVATCEFIVGTSPPDFWAQGGLASGFKFIDVGWPSWEAARDAVNKRTFTLKGAAPGGGGSTVDRSTVGSGPTGGGWYPLSKTPIKVPKTVGDTPGLSTLTLGVTERWLYMSKCNVTAPGSPTTTNRQAAFSGLSSGAS